MQVTLFCFSSQNALKICGPWVANNGQLSTHTDAQVGDIETAFFGQDVQIDFVGNNFIIAHLRVGDIQIALGKPVVVIPRRGESAITPLRLWLCFLCGSKV